MDRYFISSGCSQTFFTKVMSSFKALPPSPPVRYLMMVAIALSILSAGLKSEAAGGGDSVGFFATFAATGALLTATAGVFTGTGAAAAGAGNDDEADDEAAASLLAAGWSYWMIEGLYPSTPNTDGRTPLFALRASLSRAISALRRSLSFSASAFSFLIFSASLFLCIRCLSSTVSSIFCPRSRLSFSRFNSSNFSCFSRSARRCLTRSLIA
mmetsp:Transcript_825/g.1109  ORF Transcript_825/g.1109 Transcript_825/m.1109 type:complete len:212 (+) Transcript_825:532-1167(+)